MLLVDRNGMGTYSLRRQKDSTLFVIKVLKGTLACRSCEIVATGNAAIVVNGATPIENRVERREDRVLVTLGGTVPMAANDELRITVRA